jgi:hypothetical protein
MHIFNTTGHWIFIRFFVVGVVLCSLAAAREVETAALSRGPWIVDEDSSSRYSLLEVDPAAHRLLASHWEDGTADFYDLDKNRLITRVPVGPAVDVVVDPKTGNYFASIQVDRRIAVIDGHSLIESRSISLPGDTGALLFDAKTRRLYVTNDGGHVLWVLDPETGKITATVVLPGTPGCMAQNAASGRIYLYLKNRSAIVVVDPLTSAVVTTWSTTPAAGSGGIAFDAEKGRIIAAGDNGQLVTIDAASGKVVAAVEIRRRVEQIAFDPKFRRIFCAGPGTLSVVQTSGNVLSNLGSVQTTATATNVAVDPTTHTVWLTFTDGEDGYAMAWNQH